MKQNKNNNPQISRLLEALLQNSETHSKPFSKNLSHLDDDLLSVFVEGNLSALESVPILNHLIGCSACRKVTANLARLADEFDSLPQTVMPSNAKPNHLAQIFNSLALSDFGGSNETVFAHSADEDNSEEAIENKVE